MNLKHLQTFLALCVYKNFTLTAKQLHCAQSGVTTHIKALEEELGVQLFERMGKTVSLTAEGERLIPYAKKMLSLSTEMQSLYKDFSRLTIGVSESVATYLFGDILKEYTAIHPTSEIFLRILHTQDYCEMLKTGELDLAIVLDTPVNTENISVLQKRRENIWLFASSTHELMSKPQIHANDFTTHALLLPPPECIYRKLFDEKMHMENIRPKIALETGSTSIIKESSLSGIGLGLLPEFAVKKELIYHMFEKVNFKLDFPLYTQILMHQDKWMSEDFTQFLEIAKRHLS